MYQQQVTFDFCILPRSRNIIDQVFLILEERDYLTKRGEPRMVNLHLIAGQALVSLDVLTEILPGNIALLGPGIGHTLWPLPVGAPELAASNAWRIAAYV